MENKIVIYGGSFNPIHLGHLQMVEGIIHEISPELVYLVPAGNHPFKGDVLNPVHVLNMLKIALKEIHSDIVKIEPFEIENIENKNYTFNTIRYINAKHQGKKIVLLIGSDNLKDFKKWFNYEKILEMVELYVGIRKDEVMPDFRMFDFEFTLFDADAIDISSSKIREMYMQNDQFVEQYILPQVNSYIIENEVY